MFLYSLCLEGLHQLATALNWTMNRILYYQQTTPRKLLIPNIFRYLFDTVLNFQGQFESYPFSLSIELKFDFLG